MASIEELRAAIDELEGKKEQLRGIVHNEVVVSARGFPSLTSQELLAAESELFEHFTQRIDHVLEVLRRSLLGRLTRLQAQVLKTRIELTLVFDSLRRLRSTAQEVLLLSSDLQGIRAAACAIIELTEGA